MTYLFIYKGCTVECTWVIRVYMASHHGVVWERLIRSVRQVLLSFLKQQTLGEEVLETVLEEVGAIFNSLQITTVPSESQDLELFSFNGQWSTIIYNNNIITSLNHTVLATVLSRFCCWSRQHYVYNYSAWSHAILCSCTQTLLIY